jgi:signal transduction histidine kinase
MAWNLRPLLLDEMGLGSAIAWICRETANACPSLRIEKHIGVEESQISEDRKIAVFRTVEEVLKGVSSYGRELSLEIGLRGIKAQLVLIVETRLAGEAPNLQVSTGGPLDLLDVPKLKRRIESSGGDLGLELHRGPATVLKASWPGMDPSPIRPI